MFSTNDICPHTFVALATTGPTGDGQEPRRNEQVIRYSY